MGTTYERIADLPLVIERADLQQLEASPSPSFTRITTTVRLHGGDGSLGQGEDVGYSSDGQRAFAEHFPTLELAGSYTVDTFSAHLDTLALQPPGVAEADHPNYRRWAFESAALDLALRQAGTGLADVLGLVPQPVRFCLSMGLGDQPDQGKVAHWLQERPGTEFKLDANRAWSDDLCRQLAATGAVRVVDIKGQYTGDWIDNTPDPALYSRLAELLPEATLEDPFLDDETRAALGAGGLARVAWDAPVHELADVRDRLHPPAALNIKPSRFGRLRTLLETIDWCIDQGLPMYGGGQYELGWGRTQVQALASLFYADAANDVAPVVFHTARPGDELPASPLPADDTPGFGHAT